MCLFSGPAGSQRSSKLCTMIFTLTFIGFIFAKLKQFIIVDGPQSSATIPAVEVFSIQLVSDWTSAVGRKAYFLL